MKIRILPSVLATLVLVSSFATLDSGADDSKPCKEIKSACESAGFVKGGHKEGKGLFKDCLGKLAAGATVPGVTVPSEKIAACKAKKEKRAAGKASKSAT